MGIQIKFKVSAWKDKYTFNKNGYCNEIDFKCDLCGKTKYHLDDYVYLGFKKGVCEDCYKKLKGKK